MARRIPEDRFERLVREATEVFIARGYRLTQMSDIAEAVGVAKGTLYGYVESKDALLLLCLRLADATGPIALPESLPVPAPAPGATRSIVEQALAKEMSMPRLMAALSRDQAENFDHEVRAVIGELYDLMAANRHRIKLLDRCMDHPELRELWQASGRERTRQAFVEYLERRARAGQARAVPDVHLAARMVIETCATWAIHIHWDRAPEAYEAEAMRDNAIEFLVRGLLA